MIYARAAYSKDKVSTLETVSKSYYSSLASE